MISRVTMVLGLFLLTASLQAAESKPFVRGTLAEIVNQYNGKPFIVSYWSIDCPPCYKELIMWGKLTQHYPALPVILISTDGMAMLDAVETTRHELGVTHLASWLFSESAERLQFEIDSQWYGELPRSYFYATNGKRTAVSGLIQRQQVENWIQKNDEY